LEGALCGGRGLATIACAVREDALTESREAALRDSVVHAAEKLDLEASVKILPAPDDWEGMADMVRAYGFGPVVPNTIVMGPPTRASAAAFSSFVELSLRQRRNLVLVGDGPEAPGAGGVDIWWRGANANGAFMLALAFLLRQDEKWRARTLRLNMITSPGQPRQAAEERLAAFLQDARVQAETRVVEGDGRPFLATIAAASRDAAVTFVGLRHPEAGEAAGAFGDYVCGLREGLAPLACPVFALAAEDVDFRKIFA
ncbi:MAG: hypothetical protein J6333_07440, partial [Planctomycetes bacterium]|nr:hypothetical protein [Planctomycetota bacterium]